MADFVGPKFPIPPLSYSNLRLALREGLTKQARQTWWSCLPRIPDETGIDAFPDIDTISRNRLKWSDADSNFNTEAADFNSKIAYITQLVIRQYDMANPTMLVPLVTILLREFGDVTRTFSTMCDVCDRGEWYFAMEPSLYRVRLRTFQMLLNRRNPDVCIKLMRIGALEHKYLNIFFVSLFKEVLKEEHMCRLLDIYLYEGIKTIYRFAVAFISLVCDICDPLTYTTADSFWDAVIALKDTDKCLTFEEIAAYAYDYNRWFFMTKCVPARAIIAGMESDARTNLIKELGAPALKERLAKEDLDVYGTAEIEIMNPNVPIFHDLHLKSRILNEAMSATLNSYMADSVRLEGFELMYCTNADGWGIEQMSNRCKNLSPCLLIIETTAKDVFGAFLSTEITPLSTQPKGDGRCFIFRLSGDEPKCYKWVEANEQGVSTFSHSQFFVATRDYISIGAHDATATNAIRIDEALQYATLGPSDTYGNSGAIIDLSGYKSDTVAIADVEVLCGRQSVMRSGAAPHAASSDTAHP